MQFGSLFDKSRFQHCLHVLMTGKNTLPLLLSDLNACIHVLYRFFSGCEEKLLHISFFILHFAESQMYLDYSELRFFS